jgi:NTE family protein
MEGNISLFQQLYHIEMLNDMLMDGAFRPEYLARFDIKAPIRIPKSFSNNPDRPYHIPCIEMPADVQEHLDYEGKIDRSSRNIDSLIAMGEASVNAFLSQRDAAIRGSESTMKRHAQ